MRQAATQTKANQMDLQDINMLKELTDKKVTVLYSVGRNVRFALTGRFIFDHIALEGWLALKGRNEFVSFTFQKATVIVTPEGPNGNPTLHVS